MSLTPAPTCTRHNCLIFLEPPRLRAFFLTAALLSPGLLAQDAGTLLRERERQEEQQNLERSGRPEATAKQGQALTLPVEAGETVLVRELQFSGRTDLFPAADQARLVAAVTGKPIGMRGLQALADEVTTSIQRSGRLLARAVLPPQDITDGVIQMEIVEGRLEAVEFERGANVRAREERLRAIAQAGIGEENVRVADVEGTLLRMQDHPGVTARARLTPGTRPATSRLIVGLSQSPVFYAILAADNFGNASTGRTQGSAAITLTDLTGRGDRLRLSASGSSGQKYASLAASLPLGASGVAAGVNYGYLDYRNTDEQGTTLGLSGEAQFAGVFLDYALIRRRNFNLHLSGALDAKALRDDSIVGRLSDKRVVAGTLTLAGDARDGLLGGGVTSFALGGAYGDLDLSGEPLSLLIDQAGLKTQGQFLRVNLTVARLQALPAGFSLLGRVQAQWADQNLDTSEDFSLGGAYGVRGYPAGEGRGDQGLLGSVELRYDLPAPAKFGQMQLAGFFDAGRVTINTRMNGIPPLNVGGTNSYNLAGAGASLRWNYERLEFSASWAHALGSNPGASVMDGSNIDGRKSRQQFWVRTAVRF